MITVNRNEFLDQVNKARAPTIRQAALADLDRWNTILGSGPYGREHVTKAIAILGLEADITTRVQSDTIRDQMISLLAEAVQQKSALIQIISNLSHTGNMKWPILELLKRLYLTLLPGWLSVNTPETIISYLIDFDFSFILWSEIIIAYVEDLLKSSEETSYFSTTGFLNGLFSGVKNKHVREIKCIGAGDPCCEWEMI